MIRIPLAFCLLTAFAWSACWPIASIFAGDVYFESHVRPILKTHCFHCHGEDAELKGALDLRLVRLMTKGGESGPAITPGKHDASLLWQRIDSGEMPPSDKKLSAAERTLLAAWLDSGARTRRPEPESPVHDEWTDEERGHWSFQPIRRPPLPEPRDRDSVRTPIDAFLLSALEGKNVAFSSPADRTALYRRLQFALIGLPADPDDVQAFASDDSPDAVERLVDRLLASPRYGERWARHWLDVAGYADSDGYTEKDLERKFAFKYRDYLIRSLNADRPWNELIVEQLAGDELLAPPYRNLSPRDADRLIATGFLRTAPDGTGDSVADADLARNDVVSETVKIVSTSLLGLSVGCAQCHNHRYDPISQVDYYRLRAIFEPALDWKNWRAPAARLVSLQTDEQRAAAAAVDAEVKQLEKQRADDYQTLAEVAREEELAQVPEELRDAVRTAAKTAVAQRKAEQRELITRFPKTDIKLGLLDRIKPKEHKEITAKYAGSIEQAKARRPVDEFAHCLTEIPGKAPTTHVFFRGDFKQPRQAVEPAELSILTSVCRLSHEASDTSATSEVSGAIPSDDPGLPTTGRRLAYARHLTDGRHPLVGRVLVNRFWHHLFGRGLVATPADFGALGQRPSHPELLDWLADEFQRGGYSPVEAASPAPDAWTLKRLHRLIVTSTAFRQSSRRSDELDAIDPENRLLGRMSVRRLDAELIRDAVLSASGKLENRLFGPPVPVAPDESGQIVVAVDTRDTAGRPTGKVVPLHEQEFRRGIYVQVRRSMPLGMLEAFDGPTLAPNCEFRVATTVAPQSLLLLNNDFVLRQAEAAAERVARDAGDEPARQVERLWQLSFARMPSSDELTSALELLQAQTDEFAARSKSNGKPPAIAPTRQALATLCQAVFASNAFLYVD